MYLNVNYYGNGFWGSAGGRGLLRHGAPAELGRGFDAGGLLQAPSAYDPWPSRARRSASSTCSRSCRQRQADQRQARRPPRTRPCVDRERRSPACCGTMPSPCAHAKIAFWASAGLLVYTHVGYAGVLAAIARRRESGAAASASRRLDDRTAERLGDRRGVRRAGVIADRVANLRELDYPADRVQVIVACDGSPDETAERARAAGADLVLELPRGGKVRAQDAAVQRSRRRSSRSRTRMCAGSRDALTRLVAPFGSPTSATCAAMSGSSQTAATTRRASTGATRWRCGRSSPGCGR